MLINQLCGQSVVLVVYKRENLKRRISELYITLGRRAQILNMRNLLLLCLLLSIVHSQGWWFIKKDKLRKRCFCKAVDSFSGSVVKDFGVIDQCSGIFGCSCSNRAMVNCRSNCDTKVFQWVCANPPECAGRRISASFGASVCDKVRIDTKSRRCGECR